MLSGPIVRSWPTSSFIVDLWSCQRRGCQGTAVALSWLMLLIKDCEMVGSGTIARWESARKMMVLILWLTLL